MHVTEFGLPNNLVCLFYKPKILGDVEVQVAVKVEWTRDDAHKVGCHSSPSCVLVPYTA